MLLTSDCKKILSKINKLNSSNTPINFQNIINSFSPKVQGKWALKLAKILRYLKENEYIKYSSADNTFYNISLTYRGLAYKSFEAEEIKEFLFKSIIVPILVALITSIFTN